MSRHRRLAVEHNLLLHNHHLLEAAGCFDCIYFCQLLIDFVDSNAVNLDALLASYNRNTVSVTSGFSASVEPYGQGAVGYRPMPASLHFNLRMIHTDRQSALSKFAHVIIIG